MTPFVLVLALLAQVGRAADPWRYVVEDYRVAGPPDPGSDRRAIQAAFDAIPAGGRPGAIVDFAARAYDLDAPVYLNRSNVRLAGRGKDRTVIRYNPYAGTTGPCLVLGLAREGLSEAHYPDAFGRLDASAAPRPGVRWGVRSLDGSHPVQCAGPWQRGAGDYWEGGKSWTLEFAVDGPPPVGFGIGSSRSNAGHPAFVNFQANALYCYWTTGDGETAAGTLVQGEAWPVTGLAAGVHRVVVQLRLDAAGPAATCWVDGVAQRRLWNAAAPAGRSFGPHPGTPFQVGLSAAGGQATRGDYFTGPGATPGDFTVLGLRLSAAPLYADAAAGEPLRRLGDLQVNDLSQFFTLESSTVALLPGDEPPSRTAPLRRVPVLSPAIPRALSGYPYRSHALFLSPAPGGDPLYGMVGGIRLDDLALQGSGPFGEGLLVANALDVRAAGCRLLGGARGVDNWDFGANYPHLFTECEFGGDDAAFHTFYGIVQLRDCRWPVPLGREAIRNVRGNLALDGGFVNGTGRCRSIVRTTQGGYTAIANLTVDIETLDHPTDAAFVAISGPEAGGRDQRGLLTLRGVSLGSARPGRPAVRLVDGDAGKVPARFLLAEPWASQAQQTALVEAGAGWKGRVELAPEDQPYPLVTGPGAGRFVPGGPAPAPAPVVPAFPTEAKP